LFRGPNGQVVVVTGPGGRTLRDHFEECVAGGLPGVPRDELLGHLRDAADALDELHERCGLRHLGLNPRTIELADNGVRLADFGLVELAWLPRGGSADGLNGRYSDPLLARDPAAATADQYSLALVFAEMLTGVWPLVDGKRGPSGRRGLPRPNLAALAGPDREVIARALADDPGQRFATCRELVQALEEDGPAPEAVEGPALPEGVVLCPAEPFAGQLVALAMNRLQEPAEGPAVLETEYLLGTLLGPTLRLKLTAFREKWEAAVVSQDEDKVVYRVGGSRSFWQACLGRSPALRVAVAFQALSAADGPGTLVTARVEAFAGRSAERALLDEQGREVLTSLGSFLQATEDRRAHERHPFAERVGVYPAASDGAGAPAEGVCRDVSQAGMAYHSPVPPPAGEVYVHFPDSAALAGLAVLARVVRTEPACDGGHLVRLRFVR
jgi:hypothetical protein